LQLNVPDNFDLPKSGKAERALLRRRDFHEQNYGFHHLGTTFG
jgi:hypothetical protein